MLFFSYYLLPINFKDFTYPLDNDNYLCYNISKGFKRLRKHFKYKTYNINKYYVFIIIVNYTYNNWYY